VSKKKRKSTAQKRREKSGKTRITKILRMLHVGKGEGGGLRGIQNKRKKYVVIEGMDTCDHRKNFRRANDSGFEKLNGGRSIPKPSPHKRGKKNKKRERGQQKKKSKKVEISLVKEGDETGSRAKTPRGGVPGRLGGTRGESIRWKKRSPVLEGWGSGMGLTDGGGVNTHWDYNPWGEKG